MKNKKGFTLIELLVVISIIALLIGILLPALSAARKTARQMTSTTQVRGIQSTMAMFAQGNRDLYPGRTTKARTTYAGFVDNDPQDTANSGYGFTVSGRYAIMLLGNYFVGEYCIAPVDSTMKIWSIGINPTEPNPFVNDDRHRTTGRAVTFQASYALLAIAPTDVDGSAPPNRSEWRATSNSEAIVISDRAVGINAREIKSIWTTKVGEWKGSVGWNDNHTSFENDYMRGMKTKYGRKRIPSGTNDGFDNLFVVDVDAVMDEAYMVFYGGSISTPEVANTACGPGNGSAGGECN